MIHFYKRRLLCVSWYLSYIRAAWSRRLSGFVQGELCCSRHFDKETLREVACSAQIVLQVGLTLGLYCSIHFYKET